MEYGIYRYIFGKKSFINFCDIFFSIKMRRNIYLLIVSKIVRFFFFIGAGVKVVIFDIGFLENYLYFKKGRIKDRINWINEKIFDDGKYRKYCK